MEDWQIVSFVQSVKFTNEKVTEINKSKKGEFWVQTKTNNNQTCWPVDTGSLASFMNLETARNLLVDGYAN